MLPYPRKHTVGPLALLALSLGALPAPAQYFAPDEGPYLVHQSTSFAQYKVPKGLFTPTSSNAMAFPRRQNDG